MNRRVRVHRSRRMAEPVTDGDVDALQRQGVAVDVGISSPFSLPDGWVVHQVPRRSNGPRFSKYYYEPETGQRFRSKEEVKRYLNVEEYGIKNLRDRKMIASGANMSPKNKGGTSKFTLPEGWFVKKFPRKSPTINKVYQDPKTGRKFRSLKDVERYVRDGCMPTRSRSKRLNYHDKALVCQTCGDEGFTNAFVYCVKCLRFVVHRSRRMTEPVTDGDVDALQRQGVAVDVGISSPFSLPDGWVVHQVPRRSNCPRFSKYYYEPETGRKFRSKEEVKRYLNVEEYGIKNLRDRKMIASGANMSPKNKGGTSKFTLPEGWFVKKFPRKSPTINKVYQDPKTGRKFRSLKDVERYVRDGCMPTRSRCKRLNYHDKALVCQTCGDEGFTNAFVYCVKCLRFVVHRYCLDVIPRTFDEFVPWFCEACKPVVPYQYEPSSSQKEYATSSAHVKTTHRKKKRKIAPLVAGEDVVGCPEEPDCECFSSTNSLLKEASVKSDSGCNRICPCVVSWLEKRAFPRSMLQSLFTKT